MDVSEPERKPEESQSSFNRRLVEWSKNMAHLDAPIREDLDDVEFIPEEDDEEGDEMEYIASEDSSRQTIVEVVFRFVRRDRSSTGVRI